MKVVFAIPHYDTHFRVPPLGVGYLSAVLKRIGVETLIIEGVRDNLSNQQIIKMIDDFAPDAVCISCISAYYNEAKELAKVVKKEGYKLVLGGVHPTFMPYQTLVDTGADYVICGEGEIAIEKLAQNGFINNGIQGVYSLSDLENPDTLTQRAEMVEDLDEIPFPDWDQLKLTEYEGSALGTFVKAYPIGNICSSRGCNYACTFCSSTNFYCNRIRYRSAENVFEEMKLLVEKYGVREFHFMEDNLISDRARIMKLCDLIIDSNLDIYWYPSNGIRADMLDEELANKMVESGCYCVAFGIESAEQKILDNIGKGETVETIENAVNIAAKAGLEIHGAFVLGLPGETKESIRKTIDFAKRIPINRALFTVLDICPGSTLWKKYRNTPLSSFESYATVVMEPNGLTAKDIISAQKRAMVEFYFRPKVFWSIVKTIKWCELRFIIKRIFKYVFIKQKKH